MSTAKPSKPESAQPLNRAAFSSSQRATLNTLLNLMIPPSTDGRMPGAGDLGLFNNCSSLSAISIESLQAGLTQTELASQLQFGSAIDQVNAKDAQAFVQAIERDQPSFFALLKLQTFKRYYEHPKVLEALNIETSPPWPRGHPIDTGDVSRLDAVRSRGPIYRKP